VKLAVIGSRSFPNEAKVREFIRTLPKEWEIVSGGAMGPDTWAVDEAEKLGMNRCVFYAQWKGSDKLAGFRRNTLVANYADAVVAFVAGRASGTMDTVKKAVALRRPVFVISYDDDLPEVEEIERKVNRRTA
jgi:predicted Rossmann fold nucleotide-binding protein DprA/Smf involved in DNA uptake